MRKHEANFWIDTLAFFLFLSLVSTGFLIYLILPPASGLSIWGLDRHHWGEIHFWIAIIFLLCMMVHFILHWSWIKAKVKGTSKVSHISNTRIFIAIVVVALALFLLLAPFFGSVEKSGETHRRQAGNHVELIQ